MDEPAIVVRDILQVYADVASGKKPPSEAASWLSKLPDANGRAHGVSKGSLEVKTEISRGDLRPTAAASREATKKRASTASKPSPRRTR